MTIKILGSGCKGCRTLEKNVEKALSAMDRDAVVEHVTDMGQLAVYGVMRTPALVVNEQVFSAGRVLKPAEVRAFLETLP